MKSTTQLIQRITITGRTDEYGAMAKCCHEGGYVIRRSGPFIDGKGACDPKRIVFVGERPTTLHEVATDEATRVVDAACKRARQEQRNRAAKKKQAKVTAEQTELRGCVAQTMKGLR